MTFFRKWQEVSVTRCREQKYGSAGRSGGRSVPYQLPVGIQWQTFTVSSWFMSACQLNPCLTSVPNKISIHTATLSHLCPLTSKKQQLFVSPWAPFGNKHSRWAPFSTESRIESIKLQLFTLSSPAKCCRKLMHLPRPSSGQIKKIQPSASTEKPYNQLSALQQIYVFAISRSGEY